MLGILIARSDWNHPLSGRLPELIASFVLDACVIWMSSGFFRSTWIWSSKAIGILGSFTLNPKAMLRVIGLILALLSLPFVHICISKLIRLCVCFFKAVCWKQVFSLKSVGVRGLLISAVIVVSGIAVAAACGFSLLTLAYKIPANDAVIRNAEASARILEEEGVYGLFFRTGSLRPISRTL